jgi:hypothetical protein
MNKDVCFFKKKKKKKERKREKDVYFQFSISIFKFQIAVLTGNVCLKSIPVYICRRTKKIL